MLHPNLHGMKPRISNLAVLKLRESIIYSQFVYPICLLGADKNYENLNKLQMYAVGYGVDDSGSVSILRKHVSMYYQDEIICKRFYRKAFQSSQSPFFCARGNGFETACKHDKPIFVKFNDRWNLRGMSSMFKIFRNNTCSVRAPVLYEDIIPYIGWIQQALLL